ATPVNSTTPAVGARTRGVAPVAPGAPGAPGANAGPVGPVPRHVWLILLAATSAIVGVIWDIAWHRSIGRDTFWTPAHLAIYFGGVLSGLSCGYLILSTTLAGTSAAREATVKIWGFRGPLGAFLCAWGGIAMITSAPFDDWWHNAYGLDVRVLSPPHVVLMFGFIAIRCGTLLLIFGALSRARDRAKTILNGLLIYSFMGLMGLS